MKSIKWGLSLLGLLFFISCQTSPVDLNAPLELEPTIEEFADVTVNVTPLTEQDLRNRYGSMATYFIKHRGLLPKKNIHIFWVDITTETTDLTLNYELCRLSVDGKGTNPLDRSSIMETLGNATADSDKPRFYNLVTRDFDTATQYIKAGKENGFYFLFLNTLKRDQELLLEMPARTKEGDAGVIDVQVYIPPFLSLEKTKEDSNSGIFLEQGE